MVSLFEYPVFGSPLFIKMNSDIFFCSLKLAMLINIRIIKWPKRTKRTKSLFNQRFFQIIRRRRCIWCGSSNGNISNPTNSRTDSKGSTTTTLRRFWGGKTGTVKISFRKCKGSFINRQSPVKTPDIKALK